MHQKSPKSQISTAAQKLQTALLNRYPRIVLIRKLLPRILQQSTTSPRLLRLHSLNLDPHIRSNVVWRTIQRVCLLHKQQMVQVQAVPRLTGSCQGTLEKANRRFCNQRCYVLVILLLKINAINFSFELIEKHANGGDFQKFIVVFKIPTLKFAN